MATAEACCAAVAAFLRVADEATQARELARETARAAFLDPARDPKNPTEARMNAAVFRASLDAADGVYTETILRAWDKHEAMVAPMSAEKRKRAEAYFNFFNNEETAEEEG